MKEQFELTFEEMDLGGTRVCRVNNSYGFRYLILREAGL